MNGWSAQIRNALIAAGALNDEISFGTASVQPNYQENGAVSSFTMSQTVTVQSTRLTAMQRVLGVSNLLLAQNMPFIAKQPQYTFNGLKKLRPDPHERGGRQRSTACPSRVGQTGQVG